MKMAVWGRNGRPRLNVTPKGEFSQVKVEPGEAWTGLQLAIEVMSRGPDAAGRPPYRVEVTLVREDGGREVVQYDGLGDGSSDGRSWPVVDCVLLGAAGAEDGGCDESAVILANERVAGPDVVRASAAAAWLGQRTGALAAAARNAEEARREGELLAQAKRLKRQLAARAKWIRGRLSYISDRLWAFDDMVRAHGLQEEADAYTAGLKREHSAAAAALRAVEGAEALERRAGADGVLLGPAARVGWEVEAEIAALLDTLDAAEDQAVDAEARQSRAQARLAAAKTALAGIDSELGTIDAQRCSRIAAVQAASLAQSIDQRRQRMEAIAAETGAFPRRDRGFKLGKAMTLLGACVVAVCLGGLALAPGDAAIAVGTVRVALPAALLAGLAAGLLLAVFGLAEGMDVQAGLERRARLESDLVNLARQQSWAQQQLRTLLGGRELEDYMTALARQDELEAERQERAAEVAAAMGQVMSLRNQVDYVRTTVTRARERLTEICHAIGAGTPEAFLAQADQCGVAMNALESAAAELGRALGGRSRWCVGVMPTLLEEEILASEVARQTAAARAGDSSKLASMSVEHAARLTDHEQLSEELESIEAQLQAIDAELTGSDAWEAASRQAAAEAEAERLRGEAPAVEIARCGLDAAARDMVQAACNELEGPATEVLQFMCEDREARVGLKVVDGHVEVTAMAEGAIRPPERLSPSDLAGLGVLAVDVVAAEVGTVGIRPLVALADRGADRPAFRAALRRLSLTRQVILMLQGGAEEDVKAVHGS